MSWLDRILGREELSEEERREVDARLESDGDARAFYERVVEVESSPGPRGEMPPLDSLGVEDSDRFAADASRRSLLQRVRSEREAEPPAVEPTRRFGAGLAFGPLAIAAGLALLVWLAAEPSAITSFELERRADTRGSGVARDWQAGDAVQLRAELASPGFVAVLHLGSEGEATLLHPPTRVRPTDGPLTLPPIDSAERWTLTGDSGREVFWLVAWAESPPPAERLTAEAARVVAEAPDLAAAEAELGRWLRAQADAVESREIRR